MIQNFLMTRDDIAEQKHAQKVFWEEVKIPEIVSDQEKLAESLKRALGDNFWEMKDCAIIEGIVQNEGVFDQKTLSADTKLNSYIVQSISNIFQGFLGTIGNSVTEDAIKSTKAKLCIASWKNNYCEYDITLSDLGEIAEYVNGNPIMLKHYKEINNANKIIADNDRIIKNAPDKETVERAKSEITKASKELIDYYNDIVKGFFNIIKKQTNIDSENIVDIIVKFEKEGNLEDGTVVKIISFVQIHSVFNLLYEELKSSLI